MSNLRPNRAARRADRRRTAKKLLAMAGSAVTATALTAGVSAPAANAAVYNPDVALAADAIDIPVITTGALMGLVGALGIDSLPISIPGGGDYNLNLAWSQADPANVYNAVNTATAMQPWASWGLLCGAISEPDGSCRVTPLLATGLGAFGAVEAVKNLGYSAEGNTLWPLAGIVGDGLTNSPLITLINPMRPNGGLAARFAPLLDLFGVTTSLASIGVKPVIDPWPPGKSATPWATTSFISNLIDVTWEYNLLSDFPVTPNPFSLLNSLAAAIPPVSQLASLASTPLLETLAQLPIDFVDGAGIQTTCTPSSTDCYEGLDTATILSLGLVGALGGSGELISQLFITLPADDLPILAPLRLPAQLINAALDQLAATFAPPGSAGLPFRLGTPIADILQPALKILVNIGYSDVVTPTDIANNPDLLEQGFCGLGGVCYDRAFSQTGTPTPFGSVSPLTLQEMLQVPGDVLNALVTGFTQQLAKPFFGIIEPAPCVGCAPADAVAPQVAATEPIPGPAVADSAAKTVAAEASEPAAEAPAAVAADADRSEAPAATVTAVRSSAAEPGQATGDTDTANRTRGRSSAQAQSASSTKDAGSTEAPTSRRAAAAGR